MIETNELSIKANGGTEQMLNRLYSSLPEELLKEFQIIPSRVRELDETKYRILWCHDLAEDTEAVKALSNDGHKKFHLIVFVTNWQMQTYITKFNIPWSKCVVIKNGITPVDITADEIKKKFDSPEKIILTYTPTPHRGLDILVPVFNKLCEYHDNIELHVFSSFKLYGWEQRDEQFKAVFDDMSLNNRIINHGTQPNDVVRHHLKASHIFNYPSTWTETSCLCLIEAMSAGNVCLHSNLGALFETSYGITRMYHHLEDKQEHAQAFINYLNATIEDVKNNNIGVEPIATQITINQLNNWDNLAKIWEMILRNLLNSGLSKEIQKTVFIYKPS